MKWVYANIDSLIRFSKNLIFIIFLPALLNCCQISEYKFEAFSPSDNLAYNAGDLKFPTPMESDEGWGGGSWRWHISDGLRIKQNNRTSGWQYGLAFTGGKFDYIDTCGWRQMTINFGNPATFNRSIVFFQDEIPDVYFILAHNFTKNNWDTIKKVKNNIQSFIYLVKKFNVHPDIIKNGSNYKTGGYIPIEDTFKAVNSTRIRFMFNNCNMEHGWVTEFEVYHDRPGMRPKCLLNK